MTEQPDFMFPPESLPICDCRGLPDAHRPTCAAVPTLTNDIYGPLWEPPTGRAVPYPDGCDQCGSPIWDTGGQRHYNGHYDLYTLYLWCPICGPYEVECV